MIKFISFIISIYISLYILNKCIPLIFLKTKTNNIKKYIKSCFITNETENYICTYKSNILKYIFLFPGLVSDSIYLHRNCKYLYDVFGQTHNIIVLKYNTNYHCISDLSTHLAKIIVTLLNQSSNQSSFVCQPRTCVSAATTVGIGGASAIDMEKVKKEFTKYSIHVIGCSYGCSVAIDTFLKLQSKFGFPTLCSFTSYKSFNTFDRAIKYQKNIFCKILCKLYVNTKKFKFDNSKIIFLKSKKRYIVNHINDEIIHKRAQFATKFCRLNRIHLIYDTHIPYQFDSYYDYFFKCHTYFNIELIANIIKD